MSERKNKSEVVDQGAGVCPFGKGVVLGSDLPDSINVGRTASLVSGFAGRELGRRDSCNWDDAGSASSRAPEVSSRDCGASNACAGPAI